MAGLPEAREIEVSEALQPENSPARKPARPREATLMRRRLVREAGRKGMSYAPRWFLSGAMKASVLGGIRGDNATFGVLISGGFQGALAG